MDLYYKSTRNSNLKVTASEAILKGLAPDGGLFVPEASGTWKVYGRTEGSELSGYCL